MITFGDLENDIHEQIMMEHEDPATISAEVTKMLEKLSREDAFVVHRYAQDIAKAISFELALQDGDMVTVISRVAP
jgi:hypothetical protein